MHYVHVEGSIIEKLYPKFQGWGINRFSAKGKGKCGFNF